VLEPAPLDAVRSMLRIDASSKAPIPCARPHPSAARAQHPGTALHAVEQQRLSAVIPFRGQSMPGCFGMRIDRAKSAGISVCERAKQNAPGMESEGVRVPRRSG
jgi:hypothetical protein